MKTAYLHGVVDTGASPAEAFMVENGVFTCVGSDRAVQRLLKPGDRTVDLAGRFVCAGLNDSHLHLLGLGRALGIARLSACTDSLSELVAGLSAFARAHPPKAGEWLLGQGWDQERFSDVRRMPNCHDLDCVSTDFPICATRVCGHCLTVNSRALTLLGITARTPQPENGHIGMENGAPDGRLFDGAMELVYRRLPRPDGTALREMLRTACEELNRRGITSCQSDDYCVYPGLPWAEIHDAYQTLAAAGDLTVRVTEQCNLPTPSALEAFCRSGLTASGDLFRTGPVKIVADGGIGSRTAFLSRPYADAPDVRGEMCLPAEQLERMVAAAHAGGMQIAVHAIGDACLDRVLDAYEKALTAHPRTDHRHGIVHCQITRPEQLRRIAALGLHVYCQSIFLDSDIPVVARRVGSALASASYSWKTLMDLGVSVSNGSDCPVAMPDALAGIQCAVTRTTLDGTAGPYLPAQAVTVRQALDSYTIRGAEATFEETRKGRICPGQLADFVVLEKNPLTADPATLHAIPVHSTYLGGRVVFRAI